MNNFDLRKYLAEGRLKVNEGDMDHLMQDLERELKQHDWFYYMADDSRSYNKGEAQQRELKRLLKMLNNSPEAIALYNKYAPVQDGIDLRIKEEKIEEAIELPKDIKWKFDDVIDQMDVYNATIALTGHSESTGKDYTASAEASRGGPGGDWDWMEVDEVEEEVLEEKKGKDHDGDGDIDSDDYLMARDKAIKTNLKEWGSSDWHYFLDAMHTDLGKPADAPDIFKVLDVAGDAVDKYWDDWEEYETDREGLNMHAAQTYLKTKFPEYFKGMQALFAPMNEEYNVGKGMEKDHDFDAMLDHALTLHAGTSIEDLKKVAHDFTDVNYHREVAYLEDAIDMLEAGKHEEFEDSLKLFKDEVKKTIRSFKESIEESLRAWNVIDIDGNVTHEGLSYEEALAKAKEVEGHKIRPTNMMLGVNEDYDPDQEQLDDEDEIFMPMDDEGRPLEEAINPEVSKAVSRFIKAMAKRYDYSEQDAVYAIMAALKQRKFDGLNEGYYGSSDIDNIASTLGYDDIDSFFNDNPGAVDAIMQWAETVPDFGRMLQDAGMMQEDLDLGHEDDEPGMLKGDLYKIGKYSMELYQMMDDLEDIHGEVDLPHWWQSKVTTAKNMISGAKHYLEFELKEPAIDAMVTEDSLEDQAKVYFMQKVKRGEIDELPEDPKAAFLAQMTKDQMDHDRETLDREGGLGEASFYTKNVKDKVISKLMDQLKK